MNQFKFTNKKEKSIVLIIEPSADELELKKGQNALVKFTKEKPNYFRAIEIDYHDDCIIIWEERQFKIEIFIDDIMVYKTDLD